jgi:hypothetical protein
LEAARVTHTWKLWLLRAAWAAMAAGVVVRIIRKIHSIWLDYLLFGLTVFIIVAMIALYEAGELRPCGLLVC